MIHKSAKYPLQCLVPCWIGGDGYISGLPVLAIVLRESGSVQLSLHDLFERALAAKPRGEAAPKMIAFIGDERYFDDQLLMLFRLRMSVPCYAEYSGSRPMVDRFGILPRWDHASIRPISARSKLSGGLLFHSVCVPTPERPSDLVSFGALIDRAGFKVTRYATASGRSDNYDAKIVSLAASSGFRMSRPVFNHPLPIV